MNFSSILVGLLLLFAAAKALKKIISDKKQGKCSGCTGSGCKNCPAKKSKI